MDNQPHRRDYQAKKKHQNHPLGASGACNTNHRLPKKSDSSVLDHTSLKLPFVAALLLLSCLMTNVAPTERDFRGATGGEGSIPFASPPHTHHRHPFISFFDYLLHTIGLQTYSGGRSSQLTLSGATFAAYRKDEDEKKRKQLLNDCYSNFPLTEIQEQNQKSREAMMEVMGSSEYCSVTFMYEINPQNSQSHGYTNASESPKQPIETPLYQIVVPCDPKAPVFRLFSPMVTKRQAGTDEPSTSSELAHPSAVTTPNQALPHPLNFDNNDAEEKDNKVNKQRISMVVSLKGQTVRLDSYMLVPTDGICEEDDVSAAQKKCASELSVSPHEVEALLSILSVMKSEDLAAFSKAFYQSWAEATAESKGASSSHRALTFSTHLNSFIDAMQFVASGGPPAASLPRLMAPTSTASAPSGITITFNGPFDATGTTSDGKKVHIHFIATECMLATATSNKNRVAYNNGSATKQAQYSSSHQSSSNTPIEMPTVRPDIRARQIPLGTNVPPASTRIFMGQTPKKNVEDTMLSWLSFVAPSLSVLRVQPITKAQSGACTGTCNVYFEDSDHATASRELHKRSYFDAITVPAPDNNQTTAKGGDTVYNTWLGFWVLKDLSQYKVGTVTDAFKTQQQNVFIELKKLRQEDPYRSRHRERVCLHEMNVEMPTNVERSRSGVIPSAPNTVARRPHSQQVSSRHDHHGALAANCNSYTTVGKEGAQGFNNSNDQYPNVYQNSNCHYNCLNQQQYSEHYNTIQCNPSESYITPHYTAQSTNCFATPNAHNLAHKSVTQGTPRPHYTVDFKGSVTVISNGSYRHNPYGDLLNGIFSNKNSPTVTSITVTATPAITVSPIASTAPNTPPAITLTDLMFGGCEKMEQQNAAHRLNDSPTAASGSVTQDLTRSCVSDEEENAAEPLTVKTSAMTVDDVNATNPLDELTINNADVFSVNATDGGEAYYRQHSSLVFARADSVTLHPHYRRPQSFAMGSVSEPFISSRQISTMAVYGDGPVPNLAATY